MENNLQVALLIETSRGYGRSVALGVARYARLHGPWSFLLKPGDMRQSLPPVSEWDGQGVLARMVDEELGQQLVDRKIPTVALDLKEAHQQPGHPLSQLSSLQTDSRRAAELAAEHLLDQGFTNFAFIGTPGEVWCDRRLEGFCDAINAAGSKANVYEPIDSVPPMNWERERSNLVEWIRSLPKPVGIMAANDEHGLHVLDACSLANCRVPHDVGVVGVDNDELLCELSNPPLSSVSLNGEEGGFAAASWLDRMMKTGDLQPCQIMVEALRVVPRQSTNTVVTDDKRVAAALNHIRQSLGAEITADQVAEATSVSRRELDNRFRSVLGRSVADVIKRSRLDHAMQLLEETDYPIPQVAEAAGYSSASYMIQVFRRELDTTPAKYRASKRNVAPEQNG